jgi:hypothetical protein
MGYFKNNTGSSRAGRSTGLTNFTPTVGISSAGSAVDDQAHNAVVLAWAPKVRTQLRSSALWFSNGKTESMVMRGRGAKRRQERKLAQSISSKTRQSYGAIDTVTFQFERHGVFVHKGVGRGYNASGGFVVRTAKHPAVRPRVAVDWFNPVLDKNIPELANRIAEVNADAAINAARMKIN